VGVLSGTVVVALEQAVAAPFATRQLADLGARVIKIERPGTGDFARHYDHAVCGQSSYFVWLNRLLDRAQIANARLNTVGDFIDHPSLRARQRWHTVTTPAGVIEALIPPVTLSGDQPRMDPVPAVGEHTEAILRELGLDEQSIAVLSDDDAGGSPRATT
jgi:crotonobetainyl-CoA:carnitine CoA-transferase CaiB-like acyl-CoA transferase